MNTATNKSCFQNSDYSVTRRYSDFVWLSKELSSIFPGCILPALPEKQAVGRFSTEFVESRQRGLERFLQRVATHPELGISPLFISFLEIDEIALNKKMEESKATKPKIGTSALNWIESTVNSIQNAGKVI